MVTGQLTKRKVTQTSKGNALIQVIAMTLLYTVFLLSVYKRNRRKRKNIFLMC